MTDDVTDEQLAEIERDLTVRERISGAESYAENLAVIQGERSGTTIGDADRRLLAAVPLLVRALRDERDEAGRLQNEWDHAAAKAQEWRGENESLRERLAAVEAAIRAEIASWRHEVVEDCWYTCPAATDERDGGHCCNDNAGTTCDCGLESRRARILAALAAPTGQEAEG